MPSSKRSTPKPSNTRVGVPTPKMSDRQETNIAVARTMSAQRSPASGSTNRPKQVPSGTLNPPVRKTASLNISSHSGYKPKGRK